MKNDGRRIVRYLALWFRINANHLRVVPHIVQKLVLETNKVYDMDTSGKREAYKIPAMAGRDGDMMRKLVNDIELLNGELVDLVQNIDAWNVFPVSLNNVDELIDRCVNAAENIGRHDAILFADRDDESRS